MATRPAYHRLESAARNNAQWCDVVCRFHGAHTEFGADAWTSATRTPPLYPDAVTFVSDVNVAVFAMVDCARRMSALMCPPVTRARDSFVRIGDHRNS